MKYGNKGGETGYVSDSGILLYCYRPKLNWVGAWVKGGWVYYPNSSSRVKTIRISMRREKRVGMNAYICIKVGIDAT
jgi:hypothetical protein